MQTVSALRGYSAFHRLHCGTRRAVGGDGRPELNIVAFGLVGFPSESEILGRGRDGSTSAGACRSAAENFRLRRGVGAIPAVLSIDLDCLIEKWKAGRGHEHVGRNFVGFEHLDLAVTGVCGRYVQLDRRST